MTTRDRLTRLGAAATLLVVLATAACGGPASPAPPNTPPSSAAACSAPPSPSPADPSAGSALALQLPDMAEADVVSLLYREDLATAAFDPANQPVRALAGLYPVLNTAEIGGDTDVAATLVDQAEERNIPMLLAYGADDAVPGVNSALPLLRRAPATERGQLRIVTHPAGGHAFDVNNPDARSRAIIQQVLTFLAGRLR